MFNIDKWKKCPYVFKWFIFVLCLIFVIDYFSIYLTICLPKKNEIKNAINFIR